MKTTTLAVLSLLSANPALSHTAAASQPTRMQASGRF